MTVSSETGRSGPFIGNGVTKVFNYDFRILDERHLSVIRMAANGVEVTAGLGVDYAVSGVGNNGGGAITFAQAPVSGEAITLLLNVPFVQETDLENQGAYYAETVESALDLATMRDQQLREYMGRAIVVPASETAPPILPPATERAGKGAAFDSYGNLTAGELLETGFISAAMRPMVEAATLQLARGALGLGNVATKNISHGLQDDGAGNIRANFPVTRVNSNQAVDASFDLDRYVATAAATFTLPKNDTLWNGFGFWVEADGGDVTLAPNAADKISGTNASGQTFTIPDGASVHVNTDAAGNWYIEGMPWLAQKPKSCAGIYNIAAADNAKILKHDSGAFGSFRIPSIANLPAKFRCLIINGETTPIGKGVGNTNLGSFLMYPGQAYLLIKDGASVRVVGGKQLYTIDSVALFTDAVDGSNDPLISDGLGAGARARKTLAGSQTALYREFNHNGSQPSVTNTGTFNESLTFGGQPINTGAFYWKGSSEGGFVWRPAGAGSPYCAIIGDGAIMIGKNIWTDGGGVVSTAFQIHQNAIFDVGIPGEANSGFAFGSHGNPGGAHIATDGAGWTINIVGSYRVNGAGGAGAHINALGAGVINHSGGITVAITNSPNIGAWFRLTGPVLVSMGGGVIYTGAPLAGCQKWTVGPAAYLSTSNNTANIPGTIPGTPAVNQAPTASTGWVL
jgi:hypothetical protein